MMIWPKGLLAGLILSLTSLTADSNEAKQIGWGELLPKQTKAFDDPFLKLSEDQLEDLGLVARVRFLKDSGKVEEDSKTAKEGEDIEKRLEADGIDVDWLLAQRERVAQERRKAAESVDRGIDGSRVKVPGYMLPLKRVQGQVTEFLLLPWVGACIHTPPPPPNQMIHVAAPDGVEDKGRFAAIWLEGLIELKPASYDLFLVDGTQSVKVAYTMTTHRISEYSASESDILAQVAVPEYEVEHGWWQKMQMKVSLMFTQTMTSIRDRKSSGPLWTGVLVALLYGLVHTLGPGHGKAVVISYFVGEGGSLLRGVGMGTKIAVFHVLSAVIVVWLFDFAVRQATGAAPSDYRMVKLASYSAIALIGGWMLRKSLRAGRHDHDNHHHHHSECGACQAMEKERNGVSGWLALAVGSVPCTGALLVLLFGMANDLLGPAILMVVAISVGMAIAMSGIGVLAILGRQVVDRRLAGNEEKHQRFAFWSRIAGDAAVILIGISLFCLTLFFDPTRLP